jgi:hypothetical protein
MKICPAILKTQHANKITSQEMIIAKAGAYVRENNMIMYE